MRQIAKFSYISEASAAASHLISEYGGAGELSVRKPNSILAEALLCAMVSNAWSVARNDLIVRRRPSGQPDLAGPRGITLPSVSLSHSRGWVACAASMGGPVGIDIEVRRAGRAIVDIARFAFGPREIDRVAQEGEAGFYRIWTLREALAKATGAGLALAADRCDRFDAGPETGDWTNEIDGAPWQFHHQAIDAGSSLFHLAIAHLPGDARDSGPIEFWHAGELRA